MANSWWAGSFKKPNHKKSNDVYKARPASSGRVIKAPDRLVQDRLEGIPKYTDEEREAKLKQTLEKSLRLTSRLVRWMDKNSEEGESEEEEEDFSFSSERRMRKRKQARSFREESESDEDIPLRQRANKRKRENTPEGRENLELYDWEGRQFEGQPIPPEQPLLVTGGVMKDYQLAGLKWVTSLRKLGASGILADEMGLGKTLQTISVFCQLYESERDPGPFLVIAPLSTISNWEQEVKRFAPAAPVHLLYPKREAEQWWDRLNETTPCEELGGRQIASIFITTYDTAISIRTILDQVKWSFIVVDEGHRIKNRKCRLTTVLKSFESRNRLLLTGTPLQNNMGELWALLNFLQPDLFDDFEIFESWFSAKSLHEDKGEKARLLAQEEKKNVLSSIHRIIGPFLLRRVKAEVELSIPPKTEVLVYCPFTEVQARQYQYFQGLLVKAKEQAEEEGPMLGGNLGSYGMQYMMDLRSAVNHPYILENPGTQDQNMIDVCGKLQVLDQMLTRLMKDGHKTLVFSQMTRLLDIIANYLKMKGIPYCFLDGRMPYLDRQKNVDQFTNDPNNTFMVFLLSTRAGGLGINLTAADTCIIYDSDWNPQADLQAQDRCHRIRQTKPVMVYRLVTKGTIDQMMVERAQAKRALERLVVHRDKFKSGGRSLKSTQRGGNGMEIMKMLLNEDEAAASCTAGKTAGLEQEVLDSIMDRTNVEHFKEKMKLVNGKTPEQMLKDMEAEEIEAEKVEEEKRKAKKRGKGKSKGKRLTNEKCPSCGAVFIYANSLQKHIALNKCKMFKKQKECDFECNKCQKGFHSQPELTLHSAVHLGLKPYKCKHCGKGYSSPNCVKDHVRVYHPEHAGKYSEHKGTLFPETLSCDKFPVKKCSVGVAKQFECLEGPIQKYYNRKDGYYTIQTLPESEPEEENVQKDVGKRATALRTLQLPESRKSTCKLCGHTTATKDGMIAHMKWKHRENPPPMVTCSLCGYKSVSNDGMAAHMKLEHGPCLVCGYTALPNDNFDCSVLHAGIASKSINRILHSTPASRGVAGEGPCITID